MSDLSELYTSDICYDNIGFMGRSELNNSDSDSAGDSVMIDYTKISMMGTNKFCFTATDKPQYQLSTKKISTTKQIVPYFIGNTLSKKTLPFVVINDNKYFTKKYLDKVKYGYCALQSKNGCGGKIKFDNEQIESSGRFGIISEWHDHTVDHFNTWSVDIARQTMMMQTMCMCTELSNFFRSINIKYQVHPW